MKKRCMGVLMGLVVLVAPVAWAVDEVVIDDLQTEVTTTKSKAMANEDKIKNLEQSMAGGLPALQAATEAALAAEAAAREAADAAEAYERMLADQQLLNQLDEQAIILGNLDNRVSALEDIVIGRTVTWTETAGVLDVEDLAGQIAGLNVNPGDWFLMVGTNAQSSYEWGVCVNDSAKIDEFLTAVATGNANYTSTTTIEAIFGNAGWYEYPFEISLNTFGSTYYQYMRIGYPVSGTNYLMYVFDRKGDVNASDYEIMVRYNNYGSYAIGNTITLNLGSDRMSACGF